MSDIRCADVVERGLNLSLPNMRRKPSGVMESASADEWNQVLLYAVLQELKKLNALLHCGNAVDIPNILRRIDANTKKRKMKRVKKVPPA